MMNANLIFEIFFHKITTSQSKSTLRYVDVPKCDVSFS